MRRSKSPNYRTIFDLLRMFSGKVLGKRLKKYPRIGEEHSEYDDFVAMGEKKWNEMKDREKERKEMSKKQKESYLAEIAGGKQAGFLKCEGLYNWYGKVHDESREYKLDFKNFVKWNFKGQFIRLCKQYPNRYHEIPIEKSKNQEVVKDERKFIPPEDGCPVVLYQQGLTSGCLYCGLASALAYFGDGTKAKEIYNLKDNYDFSMNQWDHVIKEMEKRHSNAYIPIRYEDELDPTVLQKYPGVEDCVLLFVLLGSDRSRNHSVSICQGYIFDANRQHALKLNQENLDWCCSAPGVNVKFVGFVKAVYFYPKKKMKYHRFPLKIYDYEVEKILNE